MPVTKSDLLRALEQVGSAAVLKVVVDAGSTDYIGELTRIVVDTSRPDDDDDDLETVVKFVSELEDA